MRTGELTEKLIAHYHTDEEATTAKYIVATQVRSNGTGAEATADAVILGNWPSSGYEIEGFEIKVSRGDWLNELKNPDKCLPVKKFCDRWWLVVSDETFVKEGELPEDWGMMAIRSGHLKVVKKATELDRCELEVGFVTALMRANKRETIPIDVHNDKMKDAAREVEAAMKEKYRGLLDYVSFLNSGLGIELKYDKDFYGEYIYQWTARIKKIGSTRSKEELLGVLKSAIAEDLESIGYKLWSARSDAKEILKITDKALKEGGSNWAERE